MGREHANNELPSPLAEVLREFHWWIDNYLESDALSPETELHHYTSSEGLVGILRQKEFWFTDAYHLNDPGEIRHGIDVARKILKSSDLGAWGERVGSSSDLFRCFVASFSSDRNNLMQWRLYGGNGGGFRVTVIPSSFKTPDDSHQFANKVVYGKEAIRESHKKAIDKILELSERTEVVAELKRTNGNQKFEDELCLLLHSPLLWNSIYSKHEAYEHEREIRSVIMGDAEKFKDSDLVKHRIRGGSLVPFIPVKFAGTCSIKEIMAGPAAPDEAVNSVKRLLDENGWPQVSVTESSLPFRP